MSRYDFVLYAAQSDDFVERLRGLGLVELTVRGWEPSEEDRQLLLDIEGCAKAVDFLTAFAADPDHAVLKGERYGSGREAYERYAEAQREVAAVRADLARLEKTAEELRPWGPFDVRRCEALAADGVLLRYFSAQRGTYEKMLPEWSEHYTLSEVARTDSTVWFVAVTAPGEELSLDAQEMKAPQMDIREAERRIAECGERLAALDAGFARAAASLDLIRDYAASLRERMQAVQVRATATEAADGRLVLLEGWAEKETSSAVDALLEEYPNVVWIKRDPTPEDDTPVKLRNGWFARIFEMVGDMYARPKYGTLDLTPFFAPFYMLFFGICLNDAGYGLVLLALGLWMLHKNRKPGMMRRAAWFATLCASATVLFGGFCGSFFGASMQGWVPTGADGEPLFRFFDFQGRFFSVALALGMVQILFGLAINVYVTSRTFGIKHAFGTLGWLVILLAGSLAGGLPMLNEAWVIPGFSLSSPAFYAALAVGGFMMLFLNTPDKLHNPLVNLGSGLWNFYNNLTGLLSDVLSYIRLFAIGLSGGVLALVFNDLAEGLSPDIPVVKVIVMALILVVGHAINLFMSTISSFVHPMRLTFVEFYKNAGFEMASRSFEPLKKENNE